MTAIHAERDQVGLPLRGALQRMRPFLGLLRPHRRLLAQAVCAGIGHHVAVITSGVIAAVLVGRAVTGSPSGDLRSGVVVLLVLVVPLIVLPWLETQLAHVMAFRVLVDVRSQVFAAFERLAPGGLIERRVGAVGATAMADVELLEIFFAHTLTQLVSATIVPIGATIAVALFHPVLAAVLVPVLVASATIPAWLRHGSLQSGVELRERLGELGADVVDSIQGMRELLTAGAGPRRLSLLAQHGRHLGAARVHHARRSGLELAATDAVVTAGLIIVLVTSAMLVISGRLPAANLPAAVVLCALSFAPVVAVVDVARELATVAAAADRVDELVTTPTRVPHVDGPPVPDLAPTLHLREVRFRYGPDLPEVLHEVSIDIAAGETVALVGPSGAGKSTCAHLALRLWDVTGGDVRVGGHDIRDLPTQQLRATLAYVPQDVFLFNCSIADNIRMARPTAPDDHVRQVAAEARAAGFIDALPQGYDTVTGELGDSLSGGQRQRLALARALLIDAPIVVFDEAVSNLDTQSEQELRTAMNRTRAGRTTLVIAHRLSTILAADRVVMLDHGRVVATGTHRELLATCPAYTDLLATQQFTPVTTHPTPDPTSDTTP